MVAGKNENDYEQIGDDVIENALTKGFVIVRFTVNTTATPWPTASMPKSAKAVVINVNGGQDVWYGDATLDTATSNGGANQGAKIASGQQLSWGIIGRTFGAVSFRTDGAPTIISLVFGI